MKPALVAVVNWPVAARYLSFASPLASLFSRVSIGTQLSDFEAELSRCDGSPVVALVQASASADVIKAFIEAGSRDGGVCAAQLAGSGSPAVSRLVWIHTLYAGLDWFHWEAAFLANYSHRLPPFSNARGVYSAMLAEHVLLSILYFNRQVTKLQQLRSGRVWNRFPSPCCDVQTVGIVGYGDIGRIVAQRVKGGLNVKRIMATKRSQPASGEAMYVDDLGVHVLAGGDRSHLKQLVEQCDVIVAAMPKTPETRHAIDQECLDWIAAAGRRPIFVNIGRGSTVDEVALAAALQGGGVFRGAAIDVFDVEPLPQDSPLWSVPDDRLLLTSHNADISTTSEEDAMEHFSALASRVVEHGELPPYLVSLGRGY